MPQQQFTIIPGAEPFRLKGKGPKVLLIHGFTASPTEMRPIGDFLHSKGVDVYSVLLAGHGTTPEDLQTKKWPDWWGSVKNAFETIDGCEFVIGFSTGALLASRLAVEYREQLKGVILISTFLKIKPLILSRLSFLFPIIKRLKPYINKSAETEQFFKKHHLISYLKYPMAAVEEAIKLVKFTKKHVLPRVTIPTLVIQGAKDDRIHPSSSKLLMRLLSTENKRLVMLPNSQHIVSVGPDRELLFNTIYKFISTLEK
ncbi:MAG: hypothetical protein DRP02_07185 [Candidatus Gerdarchaeota archaeon]|nr:MAG: hypothetical protein DRP02_07185 [Candidatus Gerdarchaeota archaeon]